MRCVTAAGLFAGLSTAVACNQSLFDSNIDDDGTQSDASPNADAPIGNDGGTASMCPEPCIADGSRDFSGTQGENDLRYLQDIRSPNGSVYNDLSFATYQGEPAWTLGAPDQAPAILNCTAGSTAAVCAGLTDYVVLVPGANAADGEPTLSFDSPDNATYRITAVFRAPDGMTGDASRFIVSRNARHDVLHTESFTATDSDTMVTAQVEALAGDELFLTLEQRSASAPIGFRYYITRLDGSGDVFPGACQIAFQFEIGAPFTDSCRAVAMGDNNDGIGPPGMSMSGVSVSGRYGDARVLSEGQYLTAGSAALDYSGDFTIQFWMQISEPQPFDSTPYADWENIFEGGVVLFIDDDGTGQSDLCWMNEGNMAGTCTAATRPDDGDWHFYRIVRDTANDSLTLCVDGIQNATAQVLGTVDMTGGNPPHIGRNVTFNPAYFAGAVDDLRVVTRAMPCQSVP